MVFAMLNLEVGKPYLWTTELYGKVAVHFLGYNPNGAVARLSIDGGADSTPANKYPALSDGIGYSVVERCEIEKRPTVRAPRGPRKNSDPVPAGTRKPKLPVLPTAEQVHDMSAEEATKLAASMNKPARKPRTRKAASAPVFSEEMSF